MRLTVDEAIARLRIKPDYDPGSGPGPCVHTFRDAGGALIGAHHRLDDLRARMEQHGVEESGPDATSAGHGLVVVDHVGPLFLETTP